MKTLTLTEAAAHLGISKHAAQKAAAKEQWDIVRKVGNVHLYAAEDVWKYRDHRYRTRLVKALGWLGRGLYRADDIDIECPICGGGAVGWPAPPYLSEKFLCLEGHKGFRGDGVEFASNEFLIEGATPDCCPKCKGSLSGSDSMDTMGGVCFWKSCENCRLVWSDSEMDQPW